jgi:caffeoyl-CoA O-methyltransferase
MNKSFGNDDPRLARYVYERYRPEDDVLRGARDRAAEAGMPDIQVAALDALHLEVLTRACGARRAIEIGTLAGYSGVAIARGLGDGGRLDTFELEPAHARVAEATFRAAGVADRVRIHVGPALERLRDVEAEGPFDLCFIDADKGGYPRYLDWAARNLRKGGVLLADNSFLFGELVDGSATPAVAAMNEFHDRLARGAEFRATVLPTGEGLAFAVRV